MIASGPASPIRPVPPRIGNAVGPDTTPPFAKALTRPDENAAPSANIPLKSPPKPLISMFDKDEPATRCTGFSALV